MQTSKKSSLATIGKTYASWSIFIIWIKYFNFLGTCVKTKKGIFLRENKIIAFYLLSSALSALFSVKSTLDSASIMFDLPMGQVLTCLPKKIYKQLVWVTAVSNLGRLCSSISRWCFLLVCSCSSYADIFVKRSVKFLISRNFFCYLKALFE